MKSFIFNFAENNKIKLKLQQVKSIFQQAILLSGLATLLVAPMFYHHLHFLISKKTTVPLDTTHFIALYLNQLSIFFILSFLCAIIGFLYLQKLKLFFGTWQQVKSWLALGLTLGVLSSPIMYYQVDRYLMLSQPVLYNLPWYFALADAVGVAVSQEIIYRFGLLTILLYFTQLFKLKSIWPGIMLISLISAFNSYQFLMGYEVITQLSTLTISLLLFIYLLSQIAFSYIYIRFGLVACTVFHFGISIRFLIYALII